MDDKSKCSGEPVAYVMSEDEVYEALYDVAVSHLDSNGINVIEPEILGPLIRVLAIAVNDEAGFAPQPAEPVKVLSEAWEIAEKVRQDLDRQSCPDAYMRLAVESIVKHYGSDVASIHLQDLKNALAQAVELRQQITLMDEHAKGEVWRWQGDGTDSLETMGNRMGVLIYACDLRALLARYGNQENSNG